jgi:hypothetical protein
VTDVAADVFAYGLAAGLSGSAFLATVLVLSTGRGVVNALSLLVGFAAVLAVAVAGSALATDVITGGGGQQIVASAVKLALGLLLLSAAWRLRPGRVDGPDVSAKFAGMTEKFKSLEPAGALRVGTGSAVLPKRIIITLLAGAAIGASGVSAAEGLALTGLYVLVATALIWITIAFFALGGRRASHGLQVAQAWLIENAGPVAFVVALVFGVLFTGQAMVELLT